MCDISLVSTICCATFQMLSVSRALWSFCVPDQSRQMMSPTLQKSEVTVWLMPRFLRYLSTSTTFVILILFPYFLKECVPFVPVSLCLIISYFPWNFILFYILCPPFLLICVPHYFLNIWSSTPKATLCHPGCTSSSPACSHNVFAFRFLRLVLGVLMCTQHLGLSLVLKPRTPGCCPAAAK